MKIIDLLNKIANDEEVPEKFELLSNNEIFNFDDEIVDYNGENGDYLFGEVITNAMNLQVFLNDEIEIKKEDKKIAKLNQDNFQCVSNLEASGQSANYFEYGIEDEIRDIVDKINELIDKVNNTENNK